VQWAISHLRDWKIRQHSSGPRQPVQFFQLLLTLNARKEVLAGCIKGPAIIALSNAIILLFVSTLFLRLD